MIETLSKSDEDEYLKHFTRKIREMGILMDKILLPLRFGILALLGDKKLSILDP
jgi:hypothetical protein